MLLGASGGGAQKRSRREVMLLESDMDGSLEVLSQSLETKLN